MTEQTGSGIWRRLRGCLLGGSFGAVAMLVPEAALAKAHNRTDRAVHHFGRTTHHIEHVVSHRGETRARDTHLIRAAYHAEHGHTRQRHEPSRQDHIIPAVYHGEQGQTRQWHEPSRQDHIIRAAYRSRHGNYYGSGRRIVPHYSYSRLQCVPYARDVSHINLSGDAFLWWAEAAGRYDRGHMPVIGSVLNFRSTARMPLGHVAVVTAILSSRTILVTQANWIPGAITNDVTVEDVSPENNWSAVRVEYDNTNAMGSSAYPTYGFIYNRPAGAPTIYASNAGGRDEVAEAPAVRPIAAEAPNRNLR